MRLPARFFDRKMSSHKGDFGHVLVIAGSRRYVGAASLSAQAALRCGAGLVTLGFPEGMYPAFSKRLTEVMLLPLPQTAQGSLSDRGFGLISSFLTKADVFLVGPGLGRELVTQRLVNRLLDKTVLPAVVDADGLYALAGRLDFLKKRRCGTVLTPHAAEMARLCGASVPAIQKTRKMIAKEFALRYNVTLLLKGYHTVVASDSGETYVNRTGNPGMATAGSGDVLAGMIAGLMAQGMDGYEAACAGAALHGSAGDMAAQAMTQPGMIASDIVAFLPRALKKFRSSF